ncbi:MAG: hypothetical protein RIM72_00370 [Alphaproteobacteria bacterium]
MTNENTPQTDVTIRSNEQPTRQFVDPSPSSVRRGGDIMATATDQTGAAIAGREATGDDIVTVQGVSMRLGDAERHGYVHKDSQGVYTDTPEDQRPSERAESDHQQEPEGDLEVADSTSDALQDWLPAFDAQLGKGAGTQIMSEFLTDPSQLPESAVEMARANGIDPAAFLQQAQQVYGDVEASINELVTKVAGIEDHQGFWDWARQQFGGHAITAAGLQAIRAGDASAFTDWAQQYAKVSSGQSGSKSAGPMKVRIDGREIEVDPNAWETLKRNNPSVYHDGLVVRS